jgi:dTDP-6-deoxy-L-talose 4-dehydrogenase (NAD+)
MKVLVTGASGFIGRHVVTRLLARGHEVTAVARDSAKARTLPWFEAVRFLPSDIHQESFGVETFGPQDVAVHLAWPGLPNYKSLTHIEETLPADYRFLKRLVGVGIPRLVVSGTCFEYGLLDGRLAETTATHPTTPYGLAKDCLRKYLQSFQRRQPFCLQWARLFYMHGEGQHPNCLLAQLEHAIGEGRAVFDMSGGEQLRDYLPVKEVAAALVALAETPAFDGIVNVCSGTPISVRRLVEERIAHSGARIALNLGHYPYPDYEPMAFWGDPSKLHKILVERRDL